MLRAFRNPHSAILNPFSTPAKVSVIFAPIKLQHSQFCRKIARSEFNGYAGEDCELFWSTRVFEITNSKHQISNKLQIPISNDQNTFGALLL
jgi:hypothetical protein